LFQHIANVFMQQPEEAYTHGKKEQRLAQLKGRDKHEARIVPLMRWKEPGWGVSHGFRAVPQITCPLWHRARWLFLEEKATQPQWLRSTAIVEPL
jgi:hypothetical protein